MAGKPQDPSSQSANADDQANAGPQHDSRAGEPAMNPEAPHTAPQEQEGASKEPCWPANSMMEFYANRTGRNMSVRERTALHKAKAALRGDTTGKKAD